MSNSGRSIHPYVCICIYILNENMSILNGHWCIVSLFPFFFLTIDIKERFTNYTLLLIVCLRNMEQFSWNPGIQLTTDSFPSLCIYMTLCIFIIVYWL